MQKTIEQFFAELRRDFLPALLESIEMTKLVHDAGRQRLLERINQIPDKLEHFKTYRQLYDDPDNLSSLGIKTEKGKPPAKRDNDTLVILAYFYMLNPDIPAEDYEEWAGLDKNLN